MKNITILLLLLVIGSSFQSNLTEREHHLIMSAYLIGYCDGVKTGMIVKGEIEPYSSNILHLSLMADSTLFEYYIKNI